jgi:hypothetical protein
MSMMLAGPWESGSASLASVIPLSYICKSRGFLPLLVPAGIERQHVLVEHPVKQPDNVIAVFQYQPVLLGVTANLLETELRIKLTRCLEIIHGEAYRKSSQVHGDYPRLVIDVIDSSIFSRQRGKGTVNGAIPSAERHLAIDNLDN